MYILKPQITESGADQDFDEIDPPNDTEEPDELDLEVEGDIFPGAEVTLTVLFDGDPVEGAIVTLNDEELGETSSDGTLDIKLPEGEEEIKIKAYYDDIDGEIEFSLEED
jgi:hypothetical protein